ncbi:MAG: S8 family serine peptidase [Candidatus Dojkabacteria bacterium]|nr:S8 family serine peptidase [Candidatus Dojkabacteria bacterium]
MAETVKAIVKCKSGMAVCENIVGDVGASIVMVHESIDALTIVVDKNKIEQLKKNSQMEYVEVTTPDDVHVLGFESDMTLSVSPSSQTIPWGISKIRALQVQENGNKGSGIKVCILDTGIDYNHEDLKNNYKFGRNFVDGSNNPFDGYGHGTHVAGTIAAEDNSVGVIGVAPEADLIIGKVLDNNGSGSYDWIVAGIQWAIDNNAQIISMSFGGGTYSQALKDICDAAKNAGIVLVAAAGNSDGNGTQNTIGYPAKYDSVIAVASTDVNDNRSSFSSTGQELWVAAPGSNVLSTVPKGTCPLCNPSGYNTLNGTSMATPHVSGMVALMLKANPTLSPNDVKTILSTTSIDLGQTGRDVFYGYGRIDAVNAVGDNPAPVLSSITIPSSANVQAGLTVNLTATCKDSNNSIMNCPSLTWKSDNTSIASVLNGVVTGNTEGIANITCSNSSNIITSNICSVTVTAAPLPPVLKSISIPSEGSVVIGNTITLTPTCKNTNDVVMKCPSLAWNSDNTNIASVTNGVVTGNGVGTANITCSNLDKSITSNIFTITVTQSPPSNKKYRVVSIGSIGVVAAVTPFDGVDLKTACTQMCDELKRIDSQK